MKTIQGWAWLGAGLLALGLNGFYHDGGVELAHRIVDRVADRAGVVVDLASARVDGMLQRATLVGAREETASCRFATAAARFQTTIARTTIGPTRMARSQAVWPILKQCQLGKKRPWFE